MAPVPHDPVPPSPLRSTPLQYGYYGTWDTSQVYETAAHVTYVWVMAGDEGIAQMQEAQARGVKRVVIDVSWLVYGNPNGAANLRAYLAALRNVGLLQNIVALYPQDEPDVHGLTSQEVTAANAMVREVIAEFGVSVPLAVIYGTRGTPGIASYDIVGVDDYGTGARVLGTIDALPLTAAQKKLLVPGGACPWFNDPQEFFDKAEADGSVWGIAAFIWPDRWGGTENCGIRSAPTRKAYCEVGKHIKGDDTPC